MHMSDALITPAVGGTFLAASAYVINYSAKKIESNVIENRVPYMAVISAFVFAAQMINFAIPGTGSSGHIGGGMLLAILLGPQAGFLSMATVLLIQALFFADGGLLAFGCNLINMGLFTCYVAYPLIYKPFSRGGKKWLLIGTVLATVIGLQLGAFSVVIQTIISGKTALPFKEFTLFMQPIHLAIGLVEGFITAAIVGFLYERRDDLLFDFFKNSSMNRQLSPRKTTVIVQGILVITLIIGGLCSQFVSSDPDGLEWSLENAIAQAETSEKEESVTVTSTIEMTMANLQSKTAVMPDYDFNQSDDRNLSSNIGTSVSGVIGSLLVLSIVTVFGIVIRKIRF